MGAIDVEYNGEGVETEGIAWEEFEMRRGRNVSAVGTRTRGSIAKHPGFIYKARTMIGKTTCFGIAHFGRSQKVYTAVFIQMQTGKWRFSGIVRRNCHAGKEYQNKTIL
jgi:hypothetical protein